MLIRLDSGLNLAGIESQVFRPIITALILPSHHSTKTKLPVITVLCVSSTHFTANAQYTVAPIHMTVVSTNIDRLLKYLAHNVLS